MGYLRADGQRARGSNSRLGKPRLLSPTKVLGVVLIAGANGISK